MNRLMVIALVIGLIVACSKPAGEGGTSSILGKILVNDINGAGELQGQFYGQDEDVYIIYGDEDQTYDENMSTSLDGSFRFDHLTKGNYTVFAYSRCDTCLSGQKAVVKEIEITESKAVYDLGTLEIYK